MKRVLRSIGVVAAMTLLAGCMYGPGYVRGDGYYYDNGYYGGYYGDGYYGEGYYGYPGYYGGWCCGPNIGIGVFGSRHFDDHRGGHFGGRGDGRHGSPARSHGGRSSGHRH